MFYHRGNTIGQVIDSLKQTSIKTGEVGRKLEL
jgi:hypothetical protein